MKTIKFIPKKKYILAFMILGLFYFSSYAQDISDRLHFNVDWQMNAPLNTNFADKISGWGMNLEGGYFLTPHWSLEAFLDFHTNHKYVPRQTITEGTASLTTDRQESAFQLPFGLTASYRFISNGCLKPYVGTKIGTMYAQNTTYLNTISLTDKPWGFYVSPEIGVNIYPFSQSRFGFHLAAYYSYATNKSELLTGCQDGNNNIGFRLGVCF